MKKKNSEKSNEEIRSMEIVFLLDRSGSMSDCVQDTIGGYNSYLEKQKNNKVATNITTVLFDNEYELLHDRIPVENIKPITDDEYYVRGCTALLDAIGKTIKKFDKIATKNTKVLFVITTDGMENASNEYNKSQINELIKGHSNWEFMYIGANIDSYSEATSIGIKASNTANYKKTKKGIVDLYDSIACASISFCEENEIAGDWKRNLE